MLVRRSRGRASGRDQIAGGPLDEQLFVADHDVYWRRSMWRA
jgi:hypothetical protein